MPNASLVILRFLSCPDVLVVNPPVNASRLWWRIFLTLLIGGGLGAAAVALAARHWPEHAAAIVAAAMLVIALAAARLAGRLQSPLQRLSDGLRHMERGQYGEAVPAESGDLFSEALFSFNRTSRVLAERVSELERSGQQLSTVLGSMVEAVLAVDDQQRILFANGAAQSLLDLSVGQAIGRPLWEVVRNRAVHQAARDAYETEGPLTTEFEILGKSRKVVAANGTRLPGQPCPGVVLVLHDVTELRRLENLRQEFVANVSHELKTPLTAIKAYAETLLAGALNDADNNVQFVHRIEEQADRLHQLILDLLSLARIESGQEQFDIGPAPLGEAVAACLAQHTAAADAKRLVVETDPSPTPVVVSVDREGLRQMLDNLVDNAVKYTPPGGRITVRWQAVDRMVRLDVEDTGIGIPASEQTRIFERFYRVDRARSRELGGTGLGLSIVKHLVQAMGGAVQVSSQLDRGSTFTIWLPLA